MKDEREEKATLEGLADTTTATGFVDMTMSSSKIVESGEDEKVENEENDENKKEEENEENKKEEENDENKKEEKKAEPKGSLRDYVRIFTFSDRLDRGLYIVALLCSIASGAALPLMVCMLIYLLDSET